MPNIEEIIRKAQKEGKFDNLTGKGRPLGLDENPHEDPEWSLAFKVLKESGFSLPWIEIRNQIVSKLKDARFKLVETRQYLSDPDLKNHILAQSLKEFRDKIELINKKITDFNLQVPLPRFQIKKIDINRELEGLRDD